MRKLQKKTIVIKKMQNKKKLKGKMCKAPKHLIFITQTIKKYLKKNLPRY